MRLGLFSYNAGYGGKPHFHMDGPFVSLMAAASVTLLRERGFVWFHWIGQGIHYDVLATREKPNLTTA